MVINNYAVYVVLGVDAKDYKDVLGLYMSQI